MTPKKILFISGSIGLGHVGRDLEIAKALRKENAGIDISWLADDPATIILKNAGEKILPEAYLLNHGNKEMDNAAEGYKANLVNWVLNMRKDWATNVKIFVDIMEREHFDVVVGDETYDLCVEMTKNPSLKKFPFAIIYDFIGLDTVTYSPKEAIAAYLANRLWLKLLTSKPPLADRQIFIGELADVPDRKFGLMLPNRRRIAEKYLNFVGYVLQFDPKEYSDKNEIRKKLGYGKEPLIVCSIGGTKAGSPLLNLCAAAYPILKKEIPDLRMVLVCGPKLPTDSIQAMKGIEVKGYVPNLYEHLAAADLCIVTGGGTVTLELTALQRPFLYFPLEHHFEQEIEVAARCERHHAGIKMKYSETTPDVLAKEVVLNISKKVEYTNIPIDGASKAAQVLSELL